MDDRNGAFIERFEMQATGSGPLDGLTFAVKDIIDVGGYVTGGGNPDWRETHTHAATNAVCVDLLLDAVRKFTVRPARIHAPRNRRTRRPDIPLEGCSSKLEVDPAKAT